MPRQSQCLVASLSPHPGHAGLAILGRTACQGGYMIAELPAALRATASVTTTMIGRRRRNVTYDALYADGRVDRDVDADEVLQGLRLPADAWATRAVADAACPATGTGPWIEYATGRVLRQ